MAGATFSLGWDGCGEVLVGGARQGAACTKRAAVVKGPFTSTYVVVGTAAVRAMGGRTVAQPLVAGLQGYRGHPNPVFLES